jgi:hypothetical protein
MVGEGLPVERLQAVLERAERGRGRILIAVGGGDGREIEIALPSSYALSPALRAQIEALPGIAMVADSFEGGSGSGGAIARLAALRSRTM